MTTTETKTPTIKTVIRLSLVLLLVFGGGQVAWWGYEDATTIPAPTVSVTFEIYVHDTPRETAPRSAVVFQALSQQERDIFLAAHTSLDDVAGTVISNPAEPLFSHLSQTAYGAIPRPRVWYHNRQISASNAVSAPSRYRWSTTHSGRNPIGTAWSVNIVRKLTQRGSPFALSANKPRPKTSKATS